MPSAARQARGPPVPCAKSQETCSSIRAVATSRFPTCTAPSVPNRNLSRRSSTQCAVAELGCRRFAMANVVASLCAQDGRHGVFCPREVTCGWMLVYCARCTIYRGFLTCRPSQFLPYHAKTVLSRSPSPHLQQQSPRRQHHH